MELNNNLSILRPTIQLMQQVPVTEQDPIQQYSLIFTGILSNKVNATNQLVIRQAVQATIFRVDVQSPSIGNDILLNVYQGSSLYTAVDIPVGTKSVVFNSGQLAALPVTVSGSLWRVDITQVGGTFPGANLLVTIVA